MLEKTDDKNIKKERNTAYLTNWQYRGSKQTEIDLRMS